MSTLGQCFRNPDTFTGPPLVLTLAAVFVLLLALAASLLPARRAASIDPMKALRAD